MERITHRELRNNSAEVLRRVAAGESFEVTNHGTVAAVLSPPAGTTVRDRLGQAGRVRPADRSIDLRDVPRPRSDRTSAEIVADVRGHW